MSYVHSLCGWWRLAEAEKQDQWLTYQHACDTAGVSGWRCTVNKRGRKTELRDNSYFKVVCEGMVPYTAYSTTEGCSQPGRTRETMFLLYLGRPKIKRRWRGTSWSSVSNTANRSSMLKQWRYSNCRQRVVDDGVIAGISQSRHSCCRLVLVIGKLTCVKPVQQW